MQANNQDQSRESLPGSIPSVLGAFIGARMVISLITTLLQNKVIKGYSNDVKMQAKTVGIISKNLQ